MWDRAFESKTAKRVAFEAYKRTFLRIFSSFFCYAICKVNRPTLQVPLIAESQRRLDGEFCPSPKEKPSVLHQKDKVGTRY